MNERTKELAERAGFVMWSDCDWKPEGEVIDWSSNYDDELEKFAELVREDEMNERIRELAIQSGLIAPYGSDHEGLRDFDYRKFAELVRKDEREACAKLADDGLIGHTIAKAIRARGET